MNFISSLFKAIWAAIKKIVKIVVNFIKKYWWLVLLVVAIWFAPAISGWLTSAGAPPWLSSAFAWIGTTVTPYVTSIGAWLSSGASSLWTSASSGFATLTLGQKAALALGAVALLAPEESSQFISDTVKTVGGAVGSVVSGVTSGLGKGLSWLWWLVGGYVGYRVLTKE